MASHIQIETDMYEQRHILRWTADEFLGTLNALEKSFAQVAFELKRLNNHEEAESGLSRKLADIKRLMEDEG